MTLGELREATKDMPDDIKVFIYNQLDEGDAPVDVAEIISEPFYCKGDSMIEAYMEKHGKPVLVLRDF